MALLNPDIIPTALLEIKLRWPFFGLTIEDYF